MERWARPSHRRGGRDNPSFSSSLLDAIYRSIDEPEEKQPTGGAPDPALNRKKPNPTTVTKKQSELQYHRHQHYPPFLPSTTSTSSSGSSSGGFFSDSDSSRLKPIRTCAPPPRPVRSRSDLPPPSPEKKKKMIASSIRSRIRDLRKGRAVAGSAPASPGARLASFLNAIFSGAGSPKKTKKTSSATTTTACSSATACTRSCLSKTPPSGGRGGGKRTVRFGPVSVVAGEDDVGDLAAAAAWKKESRRMVEEMLRGFGAELDDDDGGESDASSDLFELEDLVGRGGGYRDELPVYETTRPRHHLSGLKV